MKMFSLAILAGGQATRLRPITENIPKALVEIQGEPFIFHQLRLIKKWGIENVVICAWYLGEMLQKTVGDGSRFGLNIKYSFDGDQPLGTGGAIKKALPLLSDDFFILYGDSYLLCNFKDVQRSYQSQKKPGLMTVYRNDGRWETSNVEFENGYIMNYDKKNKTPGMRYVDYGLGLFHHSVFQQYRGLDSFDLAELYQSLLRNQKLASYEVNERFYEIGSFRGLEEFTDYLGNRVTENISTKREIS